MWVSTRMLKACKHRIISLPWSSLSASRNSALIHLNVREFAKKKGGMQFTEGTPAQAAARNLLLLYYRGTISTK